MCGIAGYIGDDRTAHEALPRALATISHRGPDSDGVERCGDVSIGMTRLAIIDAVLMLLTLGTLTRIVSR